MNVNALIRTIASTLLRGSIYRAMRKVPFGGTVALGIIGAVFYMLSHKN